MDENEIARIIVDCAYKVHSTLVPGLFETVYERALAYELEQRGLRAESQVVLPVRYGAMTFEEGYRVDLMVSDRVIVELKSVEAVTDAHRKQPLTYLRLADKRLGLLVNFGVARIKDGISRIATGMTQ
jgi:GxxExxY protein